MNEEINAVIDKVAEKVGVAVEAAGPIAETVVREIAAMGLAEAVIGILMIVLGVVFGPILFRLSVRAKSDGEGAGRAFSCIGACFFVGLGFLVLIGGLRQCLAPTLHAIEAIR